VNRDEHLCDIGDPSRDKFALVMITWHLVLEMWLCPLLSFPSMSSTPAA
jgi:hypothetical protein